MSDFNLDDQRSASLYFARTESRGLATRYIWVTFQKEGIHRYPDAETNPQLKTGDEYDVSFLGYPHRHVFHFKVKIQVFHNDRDIEFIQLKRWLENLYRDSVLQLDYKSCEMMADDLQEKVAERWPNRNLVIEVSEDGENGCSIEYPVISPINLKPQIKSV